MIWAAWRVNRSLYLASIATAAALAVWLVITGRVEQHAWEVFTSNRCSTNYPGSSQTCMDSLVATGRFSSVDAILCGILPGLLGLLLGSPIVAGEIQQNTNRLAWTQSISRTRWLLINVAVGSLLTAGIVGALVPLIWWWTDASQRSDRILPSNFDISGVVGVAYGLFAFMLGLALGALVRRTGWAFALGIPIFALARFVIRDYVRPGLVPPTTVTASAWAPVGDLNWYLNAGFLPLGRSTPSNGETWSGNNLLMQTCQGQSLGGGQGKGTHTASYCERLLHLHYVVEFQPPGHFWALQAAESGIFLGLAAALLALAVVAVRRWRT